MSKAKQHVDNLIDILKDIKDTYDFNYQNINDLDKETQDLEHEIEIGQYDSKKGYKLVKEFRRVRQERRKLSDENATLKYLYDYFTNQKTMLKDLQDIRGEIKREEDKLINRLYMPKIRNDLTIPTREKPTSITKITKLKKVK